MVEHRSVRSAPPRTARRLRGPARLLRGWAAAVVATLLAAGSHTLAGGAPAGSTGTDAGPAPVVWLLSLALAGPLCTALAGRSLSWWRLWSAVGSSQLLFHWLYSLSAARPAASGAPAHPAVVSLSGASPGAAHAVHAGHRLGADALPAPQSLPGPGALAAADHAGPAMAAAHLLAAVATVLLLRRGEAMAARVVELAVGLVLRSPGALLSRWVPALRPPRMPSRPLAPAVRAGAVVLSGLRWRGPPVPVPSP